MRIEPTEYIPFGEWECIDSLIKPCYPDENLDDYHFFRDESEEEWLVLVTNTDYFVIGILVDEDQYYG